MRRLPIICLPLLFVTPAAAQPPASPDDAPLVLATATCAEAAAASRLSQRHLAAALLGARAARAGRSTFSVAAVDAAEQAIRSGCAMDGAGERRLIAIVASLPAAPAAEGDLDLATLTCLSLAPSWRQAARSLVPFMAGWRDAAADVPLTRAALDRVGEGLPRICRDEENKDRPIVEVLGDLR